MNLKTYINFLGRLTLTFSLIFVSISSLTAIFSINVNAETDPPIIGAVEITSGDAYSPLFRGANISFRADVSDAGSGIDTTSCEYSLDGGINWTATSANGAGTRCIVSNAPVINGQILDLVIRVSDLDGNTEDSGSGLAIRTVDTEVPVVNTHSITSSISGSLITGNPTFTATAEDSVSSLSVCEYQFRIDNPGVAADPWPGTWESGSLTSTGATTASCDYSPVGLLDGERYDFRVRFFDGVNRNSGDFANTIQDLTVDAELPVMSFTNNIEVGAVQSETFELTVTDTNANTSSYQYAYVDTPVCDSSVSFSNSFVSGVPITIDEFNLGESQNGKYVCAKAEDIVNNTSYLLSTETILVDYTSPVIQHGGIANVWNDDGTHIGASIGLRTIVLDNTEVTECYYSLDGGTTFEPTNVWDPSRGSNGMCFANITQNHSAVDFASGDVVSIVIRALDEAGNEVDSIANPLVRTIDAERPTAEAAIIIPDDSANTSANPEVIARFTDDRALDTTSCRFRYKKTTDAWSGIPFTSGTWDGEFCRTTGITGLDEASYDFQLAMTDTAKNWRSTTIISRNVDATAPVVASNSLLTKDRRPELTGTVNDMFSTVSVRIVGSSYDETFTATNNGDGTWTLLDNTVSPRLDDGFYDIIVSATDSVGNVGSDTNTNGLQIDITAPDLTVDNLTDFQVISLQSDYIITGTVSDGGSGIDTVRVRFFEDVSGTRVLRKIATYPVTTNDWSATIVIADATTLVDGIYDVEIVARDNALVRAKIQLSDIRFDSTSPVLTEVTPISDTTSSTVIYEFNSTEEGTLSYSGSCGLGDISTAVAGNQIVQFSSLLVGTYTDCEITITDEAGNTDSLLVNTFEILTPPAPTGGGSGSPLTFNQVPSVNLIAVPGVQSTSPITLSANTSGGDGNLTLSWSGNFTECSGTQESVMTPATPASYKCTVTVTDEDGDTASASLTVTVLAQPSEVQNETQQEQPPQLVIAPAPQQTPQPNNNFGTPVVNNAGGNDAQQNNSEENEEDNEENNTEEGDVLGEEEQQCLNTFSLDGKIFFDVNENGEQDSEENALEDILVRVLDLDGDEVATVLSDEDGNWRVALCEGEYQVKVDESSIDSDLNAGNVESVNIEVTEDSSITIAVVEGDLDSSAEEDGLNPLVLIIPILMVAAGGIGVYFLRRNSEN